MKDIEIFKSLGIPLQTLQNWKNSNSYRQVLYEVIRELPKDYVEQIKANIESKKRVSENFKFQ
jgi:formate dehydrogenase maturation protein FdhE